MNKGIIMEVKNNYAIALNDEGIMDKIVPKQGMLVGQKIFYFDDDIVKTSVSKLNTSKFNRHNSFIKTFGSIAALFLIVFTFFFQTMKPEKAYAVVSLDINPSIQIEADSNLKIIKVEGVNADGKNIDYSDLTNLSIDDGIQKIKEKLQEKNYLDTNKEVLVGFAGDNSTYEKVQDVIKSTFSSEDIKVTYVKGDKEAVDEAKAQGISLGRYEASLKVDEETKKKINVDVAPVKEITASIKDKDNVIQWNAKDARDEEVAPITNSSSADKPKTLPQDQPIINAPADSGNPNAGINKGNGSEIKPANSTDVIQLQPEVPAKSDNGEAPKTQKDENIINIEPSNGGTIKNNTTSGKIEDSSNITALEPSKTEEISKDIKK